MPTTSSWEPYQTFEIGYFVSLLGRRKWLLILCTLAGLVITTLYYSIQEEKYKGTVIIIPAKRENAGVETLLGLKNLGQEASSGDVAFFFSLMKCDPVISRLLRTEIPDSNGKNSLPFYQVLGVKEGDIKEEYRLLQSLKKEIQIEDKDGGIYDVGIEAKSRYLSEMILALLLEATFEEYFQAQKQRIETVLHRLEIAFDTAKNERNIANRKLVEFKERNQGLEKASVIATLNDLTLEYKVKEEKYLLVKKEMEMANLELVKALSPVNQFGPIHSKPWRSWPRKRIIFPVGLLLSAILAFFIAIARDFIQQRTSKP